MTGSFPLLTLSLLAVFILAAVLTWLIARISHKRNALAYPNSRSSHRIPTPHGGGIAFTMVSLLLAGVFAAFGWAPTWSMVVFVLLGSTMLLLGVWDDFKTISPRWRLCVHLVVVILALWSLPGMPTLYVFGSFLDTAELVWTWPLLVLGWVWLINLYNFMDGIDGLAASQAIVLLAAMTFIFYYFGYPEWSLICAFMLAAVLGFAVLNWAPARIFMGDGGSGFLGFIIGFLILLSATQTQVSVWSWLIMLLLFIADATTTLAVRFVTGQKIFDAHRLHAYQKLSDRANGRHDVVTLGFICVMLFVLLPAAFMANALHHSGFWLFSALFAAFSLLALFLGAGRQQGGNTIK